MRLGERCDEIVRLIDETLAAVGAGPGDTNPAVVPTTGAVPGAVATVTPFPGSAPRPERAASGF